ncbi:MAG TPA: plastocyanin/azurin family copper-binding protein [Actinomycetota bacterium]|nr:plastocyanin/azurin family copper-binding protein [Actinomycetota bacterium]
MSRLLVCIPIALLAVSCSGEGSTVSITGDHRFGPETITVSVGSTVTFKNDTEESHSVTAYEDEILQVADYFSSGGFSSEQEARDSVTETLVGAGETYEVTLDVAGTYRYFCIPHESDGMKGTIEVEE